MVGSLNPCNLGELIVGGMIPSSATRIVEYVTDYMQENNGMVPSDLSFDFRYQNMAKLDKYRAKVLCGGLVEPPPFEWHQPTMQFCDNLPENL